MGTESTDCSLMALKETLRQIAANTAGRAARVRLDTPKSRRVPFLPDISDAGVPHDS